MKIKIQFNFFSDLNEGLVSGGTEHVATTKQ